MSCFFNSPGRPSTVCCHETCLTNLHANMQTLLRCLFMVTEPSLTHISTQWRLFRHKASDYWQGLKFVKNFQARTEAARPRGPRAGVGFLGRGQPAPPHQIEDLGSAVSSPAGSGAEPSRNRIWCILALISDIRWQQ